MSAGAPSPSPALTAPPIGRSKDATGVTESEAGHSHAVTPRHDNRGAAAQHRQSAATLLRSAEDGSPVVECCPYAGKPGRPRAGNAFNQHVSDALLSGTVLWLVCPYLNAFIGRLERGGVVRALDARAKLDAAADPLQFGAALEASHATYEALVMGRLACERERAMFQRMFIDGSSGQPRKYGNAATSGPRDVKCLHALTAPVLVGAANPTGAAVVATIDAMWGILEAGAAVPDTCATSAAVTTEGEGGSGAERASPAIAARLRDLAADPTFFLEKLDGVLRSEAFTSATPPTLEGPEAAGHDPSTNTNTNTASTTVLSGRCKALLSVMDGHELRRRKKNRIN